MSSCDHDDLKWVLGMALRVLKWVPGNDAGVWSAVIPRRSSGCDAVSLLAALYAELWMGQPKRVPGMALGVS